MTALPPPVDEPGFFAGAVRIAPATILAPMESITDREFRMLIREVGGVGLTVTEFVSSDQLDRQVRKAWAMAEIDPNEHPVSIQIYGREPLAMARAAAGCQELGADLIDLNFGCPSKRVTCGLSGSALMREPGLAREMFAAVKGAITVPMTVKMRLGWDDSCHSAPEIARIAEGEGAAMVAVHGRTRMQAYRGVANWAAVRPVKEAVSIPVVVNGDILTVEDAIQARAQSGADGVMVGRGTMRDPWLLRKIGDHFAGRPPAEPPLADRRARLLRSFDLLQHLSPNRSGRALARAPEGSAKAEHVAVGRMKKVTGYFTRGLPYGDELREAVLHSHEIAPIYDAVHAYFERLEREAITDGFTRVHALEVTDYTPGDARNLVRNRTLSAPLHG